MNDRTKNVFMVIAGFFLGIVVMSFLSCRAGNTHADLIKEVYERTQLLAGQKALGEGRYFHAIHHFQNVVDASSDTTSPFRDSKKIWTMSFPFASEILTRIKSHVDPRGIGQQRGNGIRRGKLAFALEKYGMRPEADIQWHKASELLEEPNTNKVKQLIKNMIEKETVARPH